MMQLFQQWAIRLVRLRVIKLVQRTLLLQVFVNSLNKIIGRFYIPRSKENLDICTSVFLSFRDILLFFCNHFIGRVIGNKYVKLGLGIHAYVVSSQAFMALSGASLLHNPLKRV